MSSSDLPKLWTEATKIGHIFRNQSMYFKNQSFQKISFIKVDLLVKYIPHRKKNSMKNIGLGDQLLLKNVFENFDF